MSVIYHVGFPKCASTYLQSSLFPQLQESSSLVFHESFFDRIRTRLQASCFSSNELDSYDELALSYEAHNSPHTNIFSYEGISHLGHDWGPCFWELSFDFARKYICPDSTILFVVRNPDNYLYSCFKHALRLGELHNDVSSFFLSSDEHSLYYDRLGLIASRRHFNLSKFSLVDLKTMWISYFPNTHFVQLNSSLIDKVISISDISVPEKVYTNLKSSFSSTRPNESFSDYALSLSVLRSQLMYSKRMHTYTSFSSVLYTDYSLQMFSSYPFSKDAHHVIHAFLNRIYDLSDKKKTYEDFALDIISFGWRETMNWLSTKKPSFVRDLGLPKVDYLDLIANINYDYRDSNHAFYSSLQ